MAIRLTMTPTEEDLTGKSKWWGSADLPRGVAYPCYDGGGVDEEGFEDTLTFICQIRLEDIAPYDKEALLPRKGMLYFFADMAEYPHVFEYPYSVVDNVPFEMKGNWKRDFFKNDNPIVLELGCGRGEYTVGL